MNKNTYRYKINYTYIGGSSSNSSSNENPLLLTNVDNNENHIIPTVQNIALLYGPMNPEFLVVQEGQAIADGIYDK